MEAEGTNLTKENVIGLMRKRLKGKPLSFESVMDISFYMDFAIGTEDIALINAVHLEATSYCLRFRDRFS